jgi:cytochrome c
MTAPKITAALLTVTIALACAGDAPDQEAAPAQTSAAPSAGEPLTAVELEQGIGPIRDLSLAPVDPELAATGEQAFTLKCSACHKIEERYVAPPLGTVLSRRRPEFVMNMMLNATEMVQRHPEIQQLLAEYFTPMTVQVTEEAEARAILEYLRSVQTASQ